MSGRIYLRSERWRIAHILTFTAHFHTITLAAWSASGYSGSTTLGVQRNTVSLSHSHHALQGEALRVSASNPVARSEERPVVRRAILLCSLHTLDMVDEECLEARVLLRWLVAQQVSLGGAVMGESEGLDESPRCAAKPSPVSELPVGRRPTQQASILGGSWESLRAAERLLKSYGTSVTELRTHISVTDKTTIVHM